MTTIATASYTLCDTCTPAITNDDYSALDPDSAELASLTSFLEHTGYLVSIGPADPGGARPAAGARAGAWRALSLRVGQHRPAGLGAGTCGRRALGHASLGSALAPARRAARRRPP